MSENAHDSEVGNEPENYEVTAVRYGKFETTRSGIYLNYIDYGQPDEHATLYYYFWIIRNANRTIVFDTGFRSDVGLRRGRDVLVDPREAFDALEVENSPETLVIVSHAHYDHIGNLDYFADARFIIDEKEYRFWVEDARQQHLTQQLVETEELDYLRELRTNERLEFVPESREIAPGITIVIGPGHTPGELMMRVVTASGALLLTADAVHTEEELERDMPFRHMCDIVAAVGTYQAIRESLASHQVDRIFAGHEISDFSAYPADPRLPDHARLISHTVSQP